MSTVSGSSTVNGLYTNANSISGLVSGLDTESMIENLVDSYNMKIIGYQQDVVMQQWKQEAYRDVINDLLAISTKYTNLTNQSSNLSSNTYWNSATTTVAQGENASAISVSGSSTSSVTIDSVLQVATAERVVSSTLSSGSDLNTIEGEAMDWSENVEQGTLSGTLTFTYGSSKVVLSFSDDDVLDTSLSADEAMAALINEKLADATLGGDPANQKMMAVCEDGVVSFVDLQGAGNAIWLSSASTAMKSALGITNTSSSYSSDATTLDLSGKSSSDFVEEKTATELISGESMKVTYNGNSVTFTLPEIADGESDADFQKRIEETMAEELKDAFGSSVEVELKDGAFTFTMKDGGSNTLTVTSNVNELLGLGDGIATSYISGSDNLGDLLDVDFPTNDVASTGNSMTYDAFVAANGGELDENQGFMTAVGTATYNTVTKSYTDSEGDAIMKITGGGDDGEDIWVKLDSDNNIRVGEAISINGEVVGVFDEESTIDDVVSAINNSDAGVTASFSTLTNNFVLTANDTGSTSKVVIDNTTLGAALLGVTYEHDEDGNVVTDEDGNAVYNAESNQDVTEGQDCIMLATVNGEKVTLVRASNQIDIEGLKVTVKSTFNDTTISGEAIDFENCDLDNLHNLVEITDEITFTTEQDLDPIVDLIKEMVSDYNDLIAKVKTYFTEVPLSNSTGGSYKPLTDDDASSMTESAVASYEEKAKTGLLFGDSNMRNLYTSLSSVFSATGPFGIDLANMGFSVGYGQTASGDLVDLDETKLREMLESDFDTVRTAFTSTAASNGSDGIMASLSNKIDTYASVTGVDKGILVNAAGSEHSALSLLSNTMQDKINSYQELITTWESKLSSKVTYYTAQFTKLEVLMSEMNSQSSSLAELNTGY